MCFLLLFYHLWLMIFHQFMVKFRAQTRVRTVVKFCYYYQILTEIRTCKNV
jgi:hypothetical protein